MVDLPFDPMLPTNNERHAEIPQLTLDPDPEALQPSTWAPTSDEERRIFRVWKGFTLAERSKDTLSWVWNYGVEIQSKTSRQWICMPCVRQKIPTPQSYESKGTQNAELHLWKAHGYLSDIWVNSCGDRWRYFQQLPMAFLLPHIQHYWDPSGRRSTPSHTKGGKRVLASISDFMSLKHFDPNDQAMANSLIKRFDRGEFQKLIVNWIAESQQSFKQVELPRLQQIFEYLNPEVKVTSAHITARTVHRLAVQQFERYHSTVQQALKRSPGQIHIAFDGARTRNRHALYGVTAVFRDHENQLQKVVLGIPELVERHSGENIAAEILEIIRLFGIEDKVGYFTLDNAANNETAMAEIAEELKFDPVQRRVGGRRRRRGPGGSLLEIVLIPKRREKWCNRVKGWELIYGHDILATRA